MGEGDDEEIKKTTDNRRQTTNTNASFSKKLAFVFYQLPCNK
jgi:hypothetical protein